MPCAKVYEDNDTLAFMDIAPIRKGHVLVIPKQHYNPLMDTPDELLAKLIFAVRKIAMAQRKAMQADGVNVTQANGNVAGQIVPHIHFHVIPRFETDDQPRNWIPQQYESTSEMRQFAERIRNAVS